MNNLSPYYSPNYNRVTEVASPYQLIEVRTPWGKVYSPLPDGFGMSVGSEFGTPFDTGGANQTLTLASAAMGISPKSRLVMERRFINPERSEISFDMEFNAFYSAKDEVLIPVFWLMASSVGTLVTGEDVRSLIMEYIDKLNFSMFEQEDASNPDQQIQGKSPLTVENQAKSEGLNKKTFTDGFDRIIDMMKIVHGPDKVSVRFGNVMSLRNCFVSSVGVQFGNDVDPYGFPLYAKCNITLDTVMPVTQESLVDIFLSNKLYPSDTPSNTVHW